MSVRLPAPARLVPGALTLSLLTGLPAQDPGAVRRPADEPAGSQQPGPAAGKSGHFRLLDVSLNVMGAVGSSTERDPVLQALQGGGHDPRKRGFTLQQAELSFAGAVDPYFHAEAHLVAFLDPIEGETVLELEEAFLESLSLPHGLEVKAGLYLTEFGRINPAHPNEWDWQDQPVIVTRVFGPDGMRAPGARVMWRSPGDRTEAIFGVQNAGGEQMQSFLANSGVYDERPIGGRFFTPVEVRSFGDLLWSARLQSRIDTTENSSASLGLSAAYGPNATGGGAETWTWGADVLWQWRPQSPELEWSFVKVQGEVLARRFEASAQTDANDPLNPVPLPADTLKDWGCYLQGLWGFTPGWEVGLRAEWASGSGASYDQATQTFARSADMFRADRLRIAPLLAFRPSESVRFRLQYNYDDTDALGDPAHSVWLGFEVTIGSQPAHE